MLEQTSALATLQDLKAHLHGELIGPNDYGYNANRKVWNGMIEKYPALIVRCAKVADVISAIQFARDHHLLVAVRGGGHSVNGSSVCNGGVVIDLSRMKGIWIDLERKTAWVQAGLTLGEFVQATQAYGLATTTGTVGGTGLAGLTLGGGLGWFMGKYGLTIDNLLSVDLVTADGRVLRASTSEHPDLFWGVRGGGGNFGIVTAFKFQLHLIGPVLAGKIVYPVECAREVLRFYREYTHTAPDELTVYASLMTTRGGVPAIAISLCFCGPIEEGERAVAPLRRFGTPMADLVRPRSYLKILTQANLGAPAGRSYYEKASMLSDLSDEAIDALVVYGSACSSPWSQILIQHVHGAATRVGPSETAFVLRDESYVICMLAAWDDGEGHRHMAWTHACWRALEPFGSLGVYVNFLGNEGDGRVRASYGVNHERLVALKNRYDPTNFFACNQNIKPTIQEGEPCLRNGFTKSRLIAPAHQSVLLLR